jgi:dTDP-4-dehydrorhamnose reductase
MRILVTGSQGQLGRCIQDLARNNPNKEFVFTDYQELDITHIEKVTDFFAKGNFDYCINCAAYTAVDKAENETDLAFKINAEGPKNLADACQHFGCTLIHISTDFVFDGTKTNPYTEEDIPNPLNVYGKSKLQGECYVKEQMNDYFIIRTSWVYSEYGSNFLKTMLRLGKERKELKVVNDQLGSPTYAADLAAFIVYLIENKRKEYGMYHYTNQGSISWYDFAKTILKLKSSSCEVLPVTTSEYPTAAKRPCYSVMDNTKVKNIFKADITEWKAGLARCLTKVVV